jgi:hypothetical protein
MGALIYPGSYEAVRLYIRLLRKKLEVNPENQRSSLPTPAAVQPATTRNILNLCQCLRSNAGVKTAVLF